MKTWFGGIASTQRIKHLWHLLWWQESKVILRENDAVEGGFLWYILSYSSSKPSSFLSFKWGEWPLKRCMHSIVSPFELRLQLQALLFCLWCLCLLDSLRFCLPCLPTTFHLFLVILPLCFFPFSVAEK